MELSRVGCLSGKLDGGRGFYSRTILEESPSTNVHSPMGKG